LFFCIPILHDLNALFNCAKNSIPYPESRLQAIFRKLTNKSFFEYVENQRMALAERLVCYTHHPITDIVAECGYTTLNSFYKAFRRNFGVSPSTMREKASRRL
jgi:AraC-like DNA-binding protein